MKRKILIVDDNEQHLVLMKIRINKSNLNCEVVTAKHGDDALVQFKKEKPNLIILDTLLGDTDGFEVCSKIRKELNGKQCKIIIITGVIDAVDAIKAKAVGADDYCVKTGDFNYLLDAIKKVLAD